MHKCIECENFIGGGDWGTCCKIKYDLVYTDDDACEDFQEGLNGYVKYVKNFREEGLTEDK